MNKGVVSRIVEEHADFSEQVENKLKAIFGTQNISIVDDERMPYYMHNGQRVYADAMLNTSGSIRRLNPGQLVEVEVNFIAEQVQFMIQEAPTEEEKMRLFFKFLDIVNHDQCTFFKTKIYDEFEHDYTINGNKFRFLATESKKAFIEDIEKNGFYIVRPPHKPLLFDDVIRLYEAFPEIKPVDIYVDLFGMDQRKMLRPGVIGYEYLLVLKQNSNKNFSARSTFRVNRSNLPAKDIAKKTNRSSYARTPVRLSEIYNLLASISGEDLAEFNIFTRSSALGRKSLDRILAAPGNPLKVRKLKVQDNYTNANADILAAKLKCMGLRIFFSPNPYGRDMVYDASTVISMHFGNYTIQDIPSKRGFYQDLFTAFDKELKRGEWIQSYKGEKYDICWEEVFKNKELKEKYGDMMTDELKEQLKLCVRGRAAEIEEDINKVVQKRDSSPKSSGTTKRRGRKSKAEMEALRQMQERIVAGEDIAKDLMQAAEDEEIEEEDDSDLIDEE